MSQNQWAKLKGMEIECIECKRIEDLMENTFCILNINFSLYLLVCLLCKPVMVLIFLNFLNLDFNFP